MNPEQVWKEFREKLASGAFDSADCIPHSSIDYAAALGLERSVPLKRFILGQAAPRAEWGEDKLIFTLQSDEQNQIRLDFKVDDDGWKFYLLDGLTIPIHDLPSLPLSEFPCHPFENRMRVEDVVTRRVYLYLKLRDRLGKDEALNWFRDGDGFRLNVEAWMPYFRLRKAFVLFAAWRENRYWGQRMVVEALSDERARLVFKDHEEMMIYEIATHLRPRISRDEYREVFEDPWQDRARAVGWNLTVDYEGNDSVFTLEKSVE